MHKLSALFKTIPYTVHVKDEKYFQSLFFVTVTLIGGKVYVEQATNIGRIDAVVETKS